jgi:hypothetical protein
MLLALIHIPFSCNVRVSRDKYFRREHNLIKLVLHVPYSISKLFLLKLSTVGEPHSLTLLKHKRSGISELLAECWGFSRQGNVRSC